MLNLKKSLGQHFLKDEGVINRIVAVLTGEKGLSNLLEVGPGGGALTRHLIKIPGINFKAVELDDEKTEYLIKTYPSLHDRIISQSFLDIDSPFDESFI